MFDSSQSKSQGEVSSWVQWQGTAHAVRLWEQGTRSRLGQGQQGTKGHQEEKETNQMKMGG